MKKTILLAILIGTISVSGISQSEKYLSFATEMQFSFASIDDNGSGSGNVMRWAPFFNLQGMYNIDFNNNLGVFTGLAIRNVGYIYDNYKFMENGEEVTVKKKFRTYNLGIPLGIKLGNFKNAFLYGGYEIEFPFHYKEKTFQNDTKGKFTEWFSNRVEQFQHGFIVGIQLPYGTNVKFKYYISGFHNQDYFDGTVKSYDGLNSNIFYFSLNHNLFTPAKKYVKKGGGSEYF